MARIWTVLGILALAFVITPKFFPNLSEKSEISQTVSDVPTRAPSGQKEMGPFFSKVIKFVQACQGSDQRATTTKRM